MTTKRKNLAPAMSWGASQIASTALTLLQRLKALVVGVVIVAFVEIVAVAKVVVVAKMVVVVVSFPLMPQRRSIAARKIFAKSHQAKTARKPRRSWHQETWKESHSPSSLAVAAFELASVCFLCIAILPR